MHRYAAVTGIVLAMFGTDAHAAAWEKYVKDDLGFSVSFPGQPEEKMGTYTTRLVPNAVSHYAVVRAGDVVYSTAVIETGQNERGLAILGEADFSLSQLGETVLNSAYRTGQDYGRFITVDCKEDYAALSEGGINTGDQARRILSTATGLECPTGSRLTMTILFKNARLYLIAGVASGPAAMSAGGPGRFANSISWAGVNAGPMDRAQAGESP